MATFPDGTTETFVYERIRNYRPVTSSATPQTSGQITACPKECLRKRSLPATATYTGWHSGNGYSCNGESLMEQSP
jgi:hypothetical protein